MPTLRLAPARSGALPALERALHPLGGHPRSAPGLRHTRRAERLLSREVELGLPRGELRLTTLRVELLLTERLHLLPSRGLGGLLSLDGLLLLLTAEGIHLLLLLLLSGRVLLRAQDRLLLLSLDGLPLRGVPRGLGLLGLLLKGLLTTLDGLPRHRRVGNRRSL